MISVRRRGTIKIDPKGGFMNILHTKAGIHLDYTNMIGEGRITDDKVKAIQPLIDAAVKASEETRKSGIVKGHLSKDGEPELVLFPQLPYIAEGHINNPVVLEKLLDLRDYARKEIHTVVSFGIGGSFLGGKVLFDVHCGEFWNGKSDEERNDFPRMYFSGNNVDPIRTTQLIDQLKRESERRENYKVLFVLISKSGSTIEPMSNFLIVRKALEELGVAYEVVAVTDPREDSKETLLHKIAVAENWKTFAVPDGVGGRFSVFTEVGLIIGALIGFDIESFLRGARAIDEDIQSSDVWQNPALLSAVLKYISASMYGRHIEVMMPYADQLKSLSEWYVQLLSESLGKEYTDGHGHYGRTPVVAVGTTDMHAQTQEHQEGRLDKVVSFVKVNNWNSPLIVPHAYEDYKQIKAFTGIDLGTISHEALASNRESLASVHRFNMTYELENLEAYELGAFMFMCAWAIYFEGQLAGVDAFNQPGVEVYKKLLGPKLLTHK